MRRAPTIVGLALALAGCTEDNFLGACTRSAPQPVCTEYRGTGLATEIAALQQQCAPPAEWSSSQSCAANRIAGCQTRHVNPSGYVYDEYDWYYPSSTISTTTDVMTQCTTTSAAYVKP